MTLMIELNPEEEARLQALADQEGLDPVALVHKLVNQSLLLAPPADKEDPTLALLTQWDQEDAEMTPEEVEEARRDFEEFKQNLNAERARAGSRLVYP